MTKLPPYTPLLGRIWHYLNIFICGFVFFFLMAPLFVIFPLSFNAEPYFTFSEGMLRLDPEAFSTRWYRDVLGLGGGIGSGRGHEWAFAARNSVFIAVCATFQFVASKVSRVVTISASVASGTARTTATGAVGRDVSTTGNAVTPPSSSVAPAAAPSSAPAVSSSPTTAARVAA